MKYYIETQSNTEIQRNKEIEKNKGTKKYRKREHKGTQRNTGKKQRNTNDYLHKNIKDNIAIHEAMQRIIKEYINTKDYTGIQRNTLEHSGIHTNEKKNEQKGIHGNKGTCRNIWEYT